MDTLYTNQQIKQFIYKIDKYLVSGIDNTSHDGQSMALRSIPDLQKERKRWFNMLVNQGGIDPVKVPFRNVDFSGGTN